MLFEFWVCLVGIQKVSYQNMVDQNIGLPNLFGKKKQLIGCQNVITKILAIGCGCGMNSQNVGALNVTDLSINLDENSIKIYRLVYILGRQILKTNKQVVMGAGYTYACRKEEFLIGLA